MIQYIEDLPGIPSHRGVFKLKHWMASCLENVLNIKRDSSPG